MMVKQYNLLLNLKQLRLMRLLTRQVHYIQGQSPEPKIREYFYYIDHEGMLYLDDARMKNFTSCFKEKDFLKFFFTRLRMNQTQRYQREFPYISLCGRERNFIRCDDTPVVFSHLLEKPEGGDSLLSYAHAGQVLTSPFQPHKLYMHPRTGRVYHPAWPLVGGIGLVRSKLAIELSQYFEFSKSQESPTHFNWQGEKFKLETDWVKESCRCPMNEELGEYVK